MADKDLVFQIPHVPANLPALFDALVRELLHSPKLSSGVNVRFEERPGRQDFSTTFVQATTNQNKLTLTTRLEFIVLSNSVEIYIEISVESGDFILRLMKKILRKVMKRLFSEEITAIMARILPLAPQNYEYFPRGTETSVIPHQNQTSLRVPPTALKYCPACGLSNPKEAHYCETCGSKLKN